jgi:hypothetical protein
MGAKSAIILMMLAWAVSVYAQSADMIPVEEYSFGSFERATRIVAGKQGVIYVLDADQNKVIVFSDITQPPKNIGGFGWSGGSFDRPTGITSDGINMYVSDYGNHRIQLFDRNLNYISSFSTRDTSDAAARFGYPLDVASSELGDLFVLDGENLRVLKFTSQNFYERSFGEVNAGNGKLQKPVRLTATASQIIVCEQTRIVLFDYFGNYIASVGDGVVAGLTGFTPLENGFLLVSSDTLWWFSLDGVFLKSIPLQYVITGERIEKIQDIARIGNRLYILSPRRIHILKMNNE